MSKQSRRAAAQAETTAPVAETTAPVAETTAPVATAPKAPKPYLNLKELRHTALKGAERLETQLKYDPSASRAGELGVLDGIRTAQIALRALAQTCTEQIEAQEARDAAVAAQPAAIAPTAEVVSA